MTSTLNTSYAHRIQSIDLLRGLMIILMALDHVREFFGPIPYGPQDLDQVSVGLFLTRWITNLCPTAFIFLTGISAYLYGLKASKSKLSGFLFKRGLFLILLEISVVTCSWTFQIYPLIILQVIWALGVSMIILAGLIWLPRIAIILISILPIFFMNLFDPFHPDTQTPLGLLWGLLHEYINVDVHGLRIDAPYPLLPWCSLMSLGYCLGPWMKETKPQRSIKFFILGLSALLLFLLMRWLDVYGDPYTWKTQSRGAIFTFFSFIKVTKYPPSLFYLLETLGIITLLWPVWEYAKGLSAQILICYGKVALFFYVIHLPLIHLLSDLYARWYFNAPHFWLGWWEQNPALPPEYHFSLPFVYAVWIVIMVMLYPVCAGYKRFKETHRYAWLSYL